MQRNGLAHSLDELALICADLRDAGKTIVHCHGAFDLLHPGHIRHLKSARELGDVLVVTLTEDRFIRKGPGRPAFNQRLRAESVAALAAVDHVATSPWPTGVETIEKLKPDFYVKGQDYKDAERDVTGAIAKEAQTVERFGGKIVFTDDIQFSSTKLLNDFFSALSDKQRAYLDELKQSFSASDVLKHLDAMATTRVLVVGEAIIDEYHYCTPDAMSNKSPTLSARFESAEVFAGGVVAVGRHLAGLCQSVHVLAGAGTDANIADPVTPNMPDGSRATIIARPDGPTVRKRRFVHRFLNQKLFEVTFLNDRPIPKQTEDAMIEAINREATDVDVIVVLDFGHGFITPRVVQCLRDAGRFLAVNAQINSSNRGFNSVRKFAGADYISVDEYEMRLPYGDRYGELEELVGALRKETDCPLINVTLGDRGTTYFTPEAAHHAPVFTNQVVDTIGAGDALLAATALAVYSGVPPELVPFIGNCMGGLMTQIVGHRAPVNRVDLCKFIETLLK